MVLLRFILDLRNISPSLIGDLKQSLLKLGNLHAISSPVDSLTDSIGLCYIMKEQISGIDKVFSRFYGSQLKFAYSPVGNFCLRDFHHAVNRLPMDAFVPEINESGAMICRDLKLSSVLCDRALYSWGCRDIMRKVLVLSSCFPEDMDSEARNTLMAAADKCVSVEFLLLEKQSSYLSYTQKKINRFLRCLSDLDNCSFHTCIPGFFDRFTILSERGFESSTRYPRIVLKLIRSMHSDVKSLNGHEKRWLQELKDDTGDLLQAQIIFKSNLFDSVNKIFCNLTAATNQIVNGFSPCQTCKCHGLPLQDLVEKPTEKLQCTVTNHALGKYDVIENSVEVGNRSILFLPSSHSLQKLHPISSQVDFNVIERTNLSSLSEGSLFGIPFIVSPSTCQETEASSEEMDQPDLNTQSTGLCGALYSMDQGLVCSSNCNLDTMSVVQFQCYYILQPSVNGPLLLRRLAGSEELLPTSSASPFAESFPREMEISVKGTLLEIESTNYSPLTHNRGFHEKLNLIVKESLQFGSLHSNTKEAAYEEVSSVVSDYVIPTVQTLPNIIHPSIEKEALQGVHIIDEEENTTTSITKEWEQLVVTEEVLMKTPSPVITTVRQVLSPIQSNNKQTDMKTSMILERLEAPKKMKGKVWSPSRVIHSPISPDVCVSSQKKPLIPFQPTQVSSSQLMKPNFQRLKRKKSELFK